MSESGAFNFNGIKCIDCGSFGHRTIDDPACRFHGDTDHFKTTFVIDPTTINSQASIMPEKVGPVKDEINHPAHYTATKIEPIDVIEEWALPFHLGNTLKYLARWDKKGNPLQDLKKARWYLDRYIALIEANGG